MNIDLVKKEFPIFDEKIQNNDLVYLDSANSSQNPKVVVDRINEFYTKHIKDFCDFTTIYADESDNALWYSEFFNRYKVVGKNPLDQTLKSLPLEIIDVSWMDTNIHDMRHNFFDINKLMVDDLSDILKKKQKASCRSRLVKREQNVWSFATAPKHVVNK